MPTKKRIVLHFPRGRVNKPIVFHLVKDFNLSFNILKAEVNPNQRGLLVLELVGEDKFLRQGLEYLKSKGLHVQPLSKDVSMDRKTCVDCGICVPLCPTKALVVNKKTQEVEFKKEKCIACGICLNACPYRAMQIKF
jgi:ferredoxin